ncbi:MAG TPA: nucleotide exchange factor GrpE [Gammaproteobacteria bacterium]|nr:nucleotide exchange factor GrpE [Gammaproteobacteria bacterium]
MSGDKDTSNSNLAEADPETAPVTGSGAGGSADGHGEAATEDNPRTVDKAARAKGKSSGGPSVTELEKQLEEARRTADSHWEVVLRSRAELENLRKRSERELENAHKYGLERMITELLPVKDSLELGLAAGEGNDAKLAKLREGMELTLRMFDTALEKFGVSEINPEGEAFDPEYHQAMTVQEADGRESNTVISVIQKGYMLNDRLVRPALVIVAK